MKYLRFTIGFLIVLAITLPFMALQLIKVAGEWFAGAAEILSELILRLGEPVGKWAFGDRDAEEAP